jgi:hypothetical protein
MKSLPQLYRLRTTTRSLHLPGPTFIPPRWYRLGFLVRQAAKKRGLDDQVSPLSLPFDQSPATC